MLENADDRIHRRTFVKQAGGSGARRGIKCRIVCASSGGPTMNWLHAMQTRSQPNATVDHGFSHSIVCIMAAQSYRTGKKQYWDPHNEKIVDHPV
jgi:hypothetical protein